MVPRVIQLTEDIQEAVHKSDETKSPLIIAGMHRSGTSMAASILQACGLHIGDQLNPGNFSNIKGHFENLDFVNLHEDILRAQGFGPEGWINQTSIEVPAQFLDRVAEVVSRNASTGMWGFKDPRTTLFLDFWAEFLPRAKFVFVYRSPWEVVDSLYRRGDEIFNQNANYALQLWTTYNQAVLDFSRRHPARSLVVSVDAVAHDAPLVISALNEKYSTTLSSPSQSLFENSLLQRPLGAAHRRALIQEFFPEAIDILRQLQDISQLPAGEHSQVDSGEVAQSEFRAWVMQDWQAGAKNRTEARMLRQQLDVASGELEAVRTTSQTNAKELEQQLNLAAEKLHLAEANGPELEASRRQVQMVKHELAVAQEKLRVAEPEARQLKIVRQQFDIALSDLQDTRERVAASTIQAVQIKHNWHKAETEREQLLHELSNARGKLTAAAAEIAHLQQQVRVGQDRLLSARSVEQRLRQQLQDSRRSLTALEGTATFRLRNQFFQTSQLLQQFKPAQVKTWLSKLSAARF